MRCKLEPHPEGIAVRTPFNRGFIYDLKETIPGKERRWDNPSKTWIVDVKYGHTVAVLCRRYFSEDPPVPIVHVQVEKRRGSIKLLYVGAVKERDDGDSIAYGMHFDTKKWTVIFPENVLRNWFDGVVLDDKTPHTNLPKGSYYLILGLRGITDDQDEIKSAYRRMLRQWHPDVCKEPDANERTDAINGAYKLLSDPPKKRLYDIGQKMVDSSTVSHKRKSRWIVEDTYKPALRCGVIDCDYEVIMGRAVVNRIYSWNDIVENNRVLVTSWIMGNDEPTVAWV